MTREDFKQMLRGLDESYEDFVAGVVAFIDLPGNAQKTDAIADFIHLHPEAGGPEVMQFMIDELHFVDDLRKANTLDLKTVAA